MNSEHDLVGAYVLDALSPEERGQFEGHLATCASCRAEVEQLRDVVDVLPLALEPVEPPAGLRDRIMLAISENEAPGQPPPAAEEASGSASVVDLQERRNARRTRVRGWSALLSVAAAVVIAGLGLWNFSLQQRVNTLKSADAFRQDVSVALLNGATVTRVPGTGNAPGASAAMVQPSAGRPAYLIVRGLPQLPSGKVYQLWLMRGGVPTSAGIITSVSSSPQVVPLQQPATGYTATALTVEPGPHGSPGPTGQKFLLGTLRA